MQELRNLPEYAHRVSHRLRLPSAHSLAHTIKAWTSPWTDLENTYGQLLPDSRRGCAPRLKVSHKQNGNFPLLDEIYKYYFFCL